ncbi:MAG: DNA mismatch repair endonuclease MutL [Candidatus Cloacimonetes bacterium]|nr:DNA mismatch repair endonuclease MutL [Candidatus Cloacimonadota bacterium]
MKNTAKKQSRIKILSEEVANRIAAGEVIERPVSVVKELVENAIDAGSNTISIWIERGGKQLIQVTDNGCGMSADDAVTSFERHATSKIRTVTDIFGINTLGFRGEALPSIASVSKLTLVTKDAESETATKIEFEAGKLRNVEQTAGTNGTTVSVRRLFGNIPARKKFLKSDQVEYKHILNYIYYQSIAHPQIHFHFYSEGRERLNFPVVNTIRKRLLAVFGSEFDKRDMFPIQAETDGLRVHGYIKGLEEVSGGLAEYRYLFLNGRYIKDRIIFHSIRSAYELFTRKLRLQSGNTLPSFILFIEADPGSIDFNVHPAKLEVRFRDAGFIHNFIKTTLNKALLGYEEQKFNHVQQTMKSPDRSGSLTQSEKKIFNTLSTNSRKPTAHEMKALYQPDLFDKEESRSSEENTSPAATTDNNFYRRLNLRSEEELINPWQLHQSYVLIQIEDGMLIIDQHAAHERILYEKILHRIHGAPPVTQKLLFPIVLDIPPILRETIPPLLEENMDKLQRIGFSLKNFSGDSVVIDEIPAELQEWEGGEVFLDILKQLQEEYKETEDFRDSLAKSVSCKAAIKAGQKMSRKEMLGLVNELFACEVPYFCPHGRPIVIKINHNELEKRFKRIEN